MTRRLQIHDLLALTIPGQPAMSPDGSRIVYTLSGADPETDRSTSSLWITGAGRTPRQLTQGVADAEPMFSPDGEVLAFLRDGQLWTIPLAAGEPEQRTHLPLGAGAAVWSPDGNTIAFSAPVAPEDDRAHRTAAPVVVDGVGYQADGAGFLRSIRMQVHTLDLASGEVRQLTDADADATSPSWVSNGSRLAYTASSGGADDLGFRSVVCVLDPRDPAAQPKTIAFTEGYAAALVAAPDDDQVLVVGWPGDPVGIARLYSADLSSGEVIELAGSLDRNIMLGGPGYPGALPQISSSGDVLFTVRDRGCSHLYAVPLSGGAPRLVLGGEGRVVSGVSVRGEVAVVALSTPTSFGEIVRLDLATGDETVLTAHGSAPDGAVPFERASRRFEISDGTTVEGWVLRDPDAPTPGPLLVDIHGGPHNAWNGAADEAHLYQQELVARGWTVLMLNPRGSDGYGEEFFTAVNGAWGESDAKDFLEPVDSLIDEGVADPARLAVTGYSYGGYMTCYLTSRDTRFAAAVAGGSVTDLTSSGGTSDLAHLLNSVEVGAMPWDPADRERLAAMSPYTEVAKVATPTLLLHGGADLRCPLGQAEQWHLALRERGVATGLVVYPGGSHLFPLVGAPSHRIDFNTRVREWVERYAGDSSGPRPAPLDAAHWQRRLTTLAKRHGVPGAQLGILRLGTDEVVTVTEGTLNKNISTGAPVTPDAVFQIGSISKVWTATVVMQLVDEGLITLDTPVIDVLPDLRLSNMEVARQVTLRHLLVHTSGIDGDVFTDTGRGDDAIEKYVALLHEQTQNHPMGATWSYCNAGFSLAGRVIEVLTDKTWDEAVRERLFTPLGLTTAVTLPEEALLHAAAVGHVDGADGEQQVAPVWSLPRSLGPAGLITCSAADLLSFARMHLTGGLADDGTRVLSEAAVAEMASKQTDLPDPYTLGDSWGVGWIRFDWNGHRLLGHDGNTIGQAAFLRILPEQGIAVALLTNGGNSRDLYGDLYREVFAEIADVEMAAPFAPVAGAKADIAPHVGTYERASVRFEVTAPAEDGRPPLLRATQLGLLAELEEDPHTEFELYPVEGDLWATREPGTQTWMAVTFYALPTGERYVHLGARATPKRD